MSTVIGQLDLRSSSTLNALAKLLGTVVFVEEVVGDLLQISQMAVQQSTTDGQEIRVSWVVNLDNTPWILSGSDLAPTDLNNIFGPNNGKWHQATKLGVLLNSVLVILLNVVWEVVDWDSVVLNILHDKLLGLSQFSGCEGVSFANDRNDVHSG